MNYFFELPLLSQLALIYFVAINILAFFYYGIDKLKSQFGKRRISEKHLWLLALSGGSLGAIAAMEFFHHKTKKTSFQTIFLIIFFVQIAALTLLIQ
ncbi:MAG: DUF1294 domain-containing protein [Patescibacteria group bacterium]